MMKHLFGSSKYRPVRISVQYGLQGSGAVPTSGSGLGAENVSGASRAGAELSKALDKALDWDELTGLKSLDRV